MGGHLHVNVVIFDTSHTACGVGQVSERHWQANEPFSGKAIQLPCSHTSGKRHGSANFKVNIEKVNLS